MDHIHSTDTAVHVHRALFSQSLPQRQGQMNDNPWAATLWSSQWPSECLMFPDEPLMIIFYLFSSSIRGKSTWST